VEVLQLQPEIEQYRDDGLTVLLATPDSPEVMQTILERYELNVLVLDDRRGNLRQMFNIRGIPTGFLFDREGNLVDSMVGWHREQSLPEWVEKVEQVLYQ
jgi:peroxiredoxin